MDSSTYTLRDKEKELSAEGVGCCSKSFPSPAPSPNSANSPTRSKKSTSLDKKPYNTNSTKRQFKKRDLPLSKLKERAGLKIKAQYALIKCICKEKLIAKKDQQTRLCPFCGRRVWLADRRILFQSDNIKLLRKLMRFRLDNGQCVGYYHPQFSPSSKIKRSCKKTALV